MRSVINLCLWSLMHLCLLSLRAHLLYQWSPLCSWISVICLHCNLSDQIMHRRTGERRASRVIKIINITLQREQDEDITAIEWYLMMIFKLKLQNILVSWNHSLLKWSSLIWRCHNQNLFNAALSLDKSRLLNLVSTNQSCTHSMLLYRPDKLVTCKPNILPTDETSWRSVKLSFSIQITKKSIKVYRRKVLKVRFDCFELTRPKE